MTHLVDFQMKVDKGEQAAVPNFEKLTFRANVPFVGAEWRIVGCLY